MGQRNKTEGKKTSIKGRNDLGLSIELHRHNVSTRYRMLNELGGLGDYLDIACGVGYGLQAIDMSNAKSLTAVDMNEEYLSRARANLKDIQFKKMDIRDGLGFPDNSFDTISCFETIEHIEEEKVNRLLLEIVRILRPGGRVILSTPNAAVGVFKMILGGTPSHFKEYTFNELHKILLPHFEIISVKQHFSTVLDFPFSIYIGKIYEKIAPTRLGADLIFILKSRKQK